MSFRRHACNWLTEGCRISCLADWYLRATAVVTFALSSTFQRYCLFSTPRATCFPFPTFIPAKIWSVPFEVNKILKVPVFPLCAFADMTSWWDGPVHKLFTAVTYLTLIYLSGPQQVCLGLIQPSTQKSLPTPVLVVCCMLATPLRHVITQVDVVSVLNGRDVTTRVYFPTTRHGQPTHVLSCLTL